MSAIPRIDTAVFGQSYKYEIGHTRPDGKYNVWTLMTVPGWATPAWVIVHVARGWKAARNWILETEKAEVAA